MPELIVRLVASLAVVVGLLLLLARLASKRFAGRPGAPVQVLHRQPLSRTSSVTVLTVGQRVLVLGTTEHQVSLLTELDPEELGVGLTLEEELLRPGVDAPDETLPFPAVAAVADSPDSPDSPGAPALPVRTPGAHRASVPTRSAPQGALTGSVLSPDTWRQAVAAVTGRAS